jgi:hypothetical protein
MISHIKMAKLDLEALTNKNNDIAAKPTASKTPFHRFKDLAI